MSLPTASAQSVEPETVVDAFETARAVGNVDLALAEFADDAVVTVQGRAPQSFAGRDQVRIYVDSVAVRRQILMRSSLRSDGQLVTWTERGQDAQHTVDARVQATVRSGRISSLLYTEGVPFGGAAQAVQAIQPRELPSVVWLATIGLTSLALLVGAFWRPRGQTSRSELHGRLIVGIARSAERDRKAA